MMSLLMEILVVGQEETDERGLLEEVSRPEPDGGKEPEDSDDEEGL